MDLNPNPDPIWSPEFEKLSSLLVRVLVRPMIFQAPRLIPDSEGLECHSADRCPALRGQKSKIVRLHHRGRIIVLLFYDRYLMGDRRRFDFSMIGFKPI